MKYKQFISLLFGSIIQWYDLTLCGIFALELSNVFLPNSDLDTTTVFYVIYGSSFIIRPIGAIVIGWFGDKFGYDIGIGLALLVSGTSSLIIGILPGFNSWGYLATVLFILTRFLQNFCAASQLAGVISYAPHQDIEIRRYKKGLYTSLAYTSSVLGVIVATLISSISSYYLDGTSLSWRIPFIISAIPLIIYYWLNLNKIKSKNDNICITNKFPITQLLRLYYKQIIIMSILVFSSGALYNMFYVYFITFMIQQLQLPKEHSYVINLAILSFSIFLYPLFGILSDKINRPVFQAKFALISLTVAIIFLFYNLDNFLLLIIGLCLITIFFCAFVSPLIAILSVSFNHKHQMILSSITIAFGSVLAGFSLPLMHLITVTNNKISLMYFAIALSLLGLLALNKMKQPRI